FALPIEGTIYDSVTHHSHVAFNCHAPPTPTTYTLSLHDALPISGSPERWRDTIFPGKNLAVCASDLAFSRQYPELTHLAQIPSGDRKSTRLNSSHLGISYAVFCLTTKTAPNPNAPG